MFGVNTGFVRGSKFGRSITRGSLTTKRLPHGYIKGKGVRSIGKVDSKGRFRIDRSKLLKFHVPDLTGFDLKPYVSYNTPKVEFPAPKIPKEYWSLRLQAQKEIEKELHLQKTFTKRIHSMVATVKFKALDEVKKKKLEEREKEIEERQRKLASGSYFSWEALYSDKLNALPETGEPITIQQAQKRKSVYRNEVLMKQISQTIKAIKQNPKEMKGKNHTSWSKRFLRPTRKGKSIVRITHKYGKVYQKSAEEGFAKIGTTSTIPVKPQASNTTPPPPPSPTKKKSNHPSNQRKASQQVHSF